MVQSKAQNTYVHLRNYLMWFTRLRGRSDEKELAYILNQTLIAVQEAMYYGLGMSEGTSDWEDIAFIRDYVRDYLYSGYG
ncbi:hypothetical protein [Bariatricus sp. HCP28S3_D3]|uniref:hypothetical protein n=1 Tax=Bariatricus sp. HCP28S3_D3 TaxID=3438901 RepID=UPI003F89B50D